VKTHKYPFASFLFALLFFSNPVFKVFVQAQDPHFSQFYNTPHLVNPAFTSLFQGDYRFSVNFKNQWNSFLGHPYRTFSAAGDMKVLATKNCDFMGLGVNLLGDVAGDLNFSTVQGNLAFSYAKVLDKSAETYLSFGFSAGVARRGLNVNPETDFLDEPEFIPNENFAFYDMSAGMLFYSFPRQKHLYYLGGAIFHLNRAEQSHFTDNYPFAGNAEPLYRRYVIHGGAHLFAAARVSFHPSFFLQFQGPATEINVGGFVKYFLSNITQLNKNAVHLGVFYRNKDAIMAAFRLDLKRYHVTLSYDINLSKLTEASRGRGGVEIALATTLFRQKSWQCSNLAIECPEF
jgi:type IX secretion system PorP/SprF family membrane protein